MIAQPLTHTAQDEIEIIAALPENDNAPGALEAYQFANAHFRKGPWPKPFDATTHHLVRGDARDLRWVADSSVHLVVTSPPYWTLKEYDHSLGQLGDVADYEQFLDELDKVWRECARVLVPGGRICCVVGDVCVPRKHAGRHYVMPLHADIQVRARGVGLDCLTPILWAKISNGMTEARGNGAGFYGKPYQPGAVVKNDTEYILFLRKPGGYRSVSPLKKALSMLSKEEMQGWLRTYWTDVPGESTRKGHPAPFPVEVAERLIRMFSFAGDVVLDPFAGTGSTALAALRTGRNSVANELERTYIEIARNRLAMAIESLPLLGATRAVMLDDDAVQTVGRA